MNPASWLVRGTTLLGTRRFLRDAADPERAQARVWREIKALIRGRSGWHGEDLARYPITTYADYADAIAASFRSGVCEMTGEPVVFWATTSGTSGTKKSFPMTESHRRQFQRTTPPFVNGIVRRFPSFLSEPVCYFAATVSAERSPTGLEVGFISSFNYRNVPPLLKRFYAFPIEVFADHETFHTWGPVYALATDLSGMFAVTPSQILYFLERIDRAAVLDVLEGRRAPPSPLPPVRVSAARLAHVRRALSADAPTLASLWPSLAFVSCWTAAACRLQAKELAARLGDGVALVDATYSATEGWLNVPLDASPGGPLHPGAHVMEFAPDVGGGAVAASDLLPLHALEAGRDYEVFLTNGMGMVRYRLFDVVRCTGRFRESPVVEFRRKAGSTVSLGLVQLDEAELVEALARAALAPPVPWVFAPNRTGDGLVLYTAAEADGLAGRAPDVDRALRAINENYGAYVDKGLVRPLAVEKLDAAHPALVRRSGALHAQAKPTILLHALE